MSPSYPFPPSLVPCTLSLIYSFLSPIWILSSVFFLLSPFLCSNCHIPCFSVKYHLSPITCTLCPVTCPLFLCSLSPVPCPLSHIPCCRSPVHYPLTLFSISLCSGLSPLPADPFLFQFLVKYQLFRWKYNAKLLALKLMDDLWSHDSSTGCQMVRTRCVSFLAQSREACGSVNVLKLTLLKLSSKESMKPPSKLLPSLLLLQVRSLSQR